MVVFCMTLLLPNTNDPGRHRAERAAAGKVTAKYKEDPGLRVQAASLLPCGQTSPPRLEGARRARQGVS